MSPRHSEFRIPHSAFLMADRRSFIRQTATMLGGLALHPSLNAAMPHLPLDPSLSGEDFWLQIRQAYAASPNIVNLNNGGVCPAPRATMEALDHYNRMCNEAPSYYMWRILDEDREPLRTNLALLAGADKEEIAINRNATEALNSVIFGLKLKTGDEVVLSKYDYPNMINAWKQRELRDGIKLVWVDLQLPSENNETLVNAYVSQFTPRTKVVHITHLINWCGQILPARSIADRAHEQGIEVLVDAAHSFALLDYKMSDLGADYAGTSLHKWLCGPFGSGMLYIKKDKIDNVWPLLSSDKPESDNIRKFESLGTRSFPIEMAIGYSLDLHNYIGTQRKQERLHYLKNYWMEKVADLPGIHFFTSMNPQFGCAIGSFGFDDVKPYDIANFLFREWKIHVVSIEWEMVKGVRVTPNVYTSLQDLDKLVRAIKAFSAQR